MARKGDINELSKWLKQINDELHSYCEEIVDDNTEGACDMAKKLAPVDTGILETSIDTFYSADGLTGFVFTNVEYSIYQENGTHKMPASPFFEPAFEEYYQKMLDELEELRFITGG